uniref:Uncharacterized protein n=1 Tax=Amycolatopsis vancoresmycina DSM 44592 TaxID=1292037 RepID=R1G604_9PSEU|nr:hypothetical protein [Amycolatopsis vancoresmycina]EOD66878.1 hypothetical protein H480_19183 [Amycolatopsis vancoresmycina DSM 44592]
MADDWKSYVDLDGTHVIVAANSPSTAGELLEQRGLHRAQIVQACGSEPYALGELADYVWSSGEFAVRYELVPRIRYAVGVLDQVAQALNGEVPAGMLRKVSRVLQGVDEVPHG